MNAQELFLSDGRSAEVWYCSECRTAKKSQTEAEKCCKKHNCEFCGEPVDATYWLSHSECKREDTIKKAKKLESWDGWVYIEGVGSECFLSVDDLIDEFADQNDFEIPEYVFICNPVPFRTPDIEDFISGCLDEHYEGAYEEINSESYRKLSMAFDEFRKANQHIVSYQPDFTRMVRVRDKNR